MLLPQVFIGTRHLPPTKQSLGLPSWGKVNFKKSDENFHFLMRYAGLMRGSIHNLLKRITGTGRAGDENSQKHHLQAREVVVINKSNIFCPHLPAVPRRSSRLPATWCWSRHSAGAETPLGDPGLRFTPDGKEPLSLFLAVLVSSVPPSR